MMVGLNDWVVNIIYGKDCKMILNEGALLGRACFMQLLCVCGDMITPQGNGIDVLNVFRKCGQV